MEFTIKVALQVAKAFHFMHINTPPIFHRKIFFFNQHCRCVSKFFFRFFLFAPNLCIFHYRLLTLFLSLFSVVPLFSSFYFCLLLSSFTLVLPGDIKSPNILLTSDLNIKVADFGLSTWKTNKNKLNQEKTMVGTIRWMVIFFSKYKKKTQSKKMKKNNRSFVVCSSWLLFWF